jgi:hypothetical protein
VALVFALQVGAIYWLGDNAPIRPRSPKGAPTLHLSGNTSGELLALTDPTLFALPHRQAFSGDAWLRIPEVPTASFSWSEPPRWLGAPTQELGASFNRVIETYRFNQLQVISRAEPDVAPPKLSRPALAERSTFRLEGGLAGRRLITKFNLPAWAHTDILNDTVVKLVVNAAGVPISISLLSTSGLKAADDYARDLARTARFEPLGGGGPKRGATVLEGLSIGEITFDWQTLPPALTNAIPQPAKQ